MAANQVWIRNAESGADEVYLVATVSGDPDDSGNLTVEMPKGGKQTIHKSETYPANPEGLSCPDNTMLIHLSEATLLNNLRLRFKTQHIYTLTGSILLAVNPFEDLPIYSEKIMADYKDKGLGKAPPHVYGIAEAAYQRLAKTRMSQSIVVSGESGAGKTETNKHLMHYLAWRSRSSGGVASLAEAILQSNPVLEAFGNAKTSRNNNSSRFGKFIKILIDTKGTISGARTASYLLEKSRVATVAEGERNYHVFYHLVAGSPKAQASSLNLDKGAAAFHYLNQSSVKELSMMKDEPMFKELVGAFKACGVPDAQVTDVFGALAGILHIGNIAFDGDEESKIKVAEPLTHATAALGVDLAACLTTKTMSVGGEKTVVPLNPEKALAARDAITKAIYVKLFEWIVSAVNKTLGTGSTDAASTFVGLLDVFGFEFFGTNNSFEQLAINFANEKLQQFFLKFVFRAEEAEYFAENVKYTPVEFQDNEGCIELIEKTPSGILRILDTQCKTPKASDESFSVQVNKEHKKHPFFMVPRAAGHKKFKEEEAFVVRHFAGNVCYMSAGFMEKNNDTLSPDFELALAGAKNGLLAAIFAADGGAKKGGGKKGGTFNSVGRRFIGDLDALMTDLGVTHAHFIRCIKPNLQLAKQVLTPSLVLSQLRCSGTLEAVQLISASYPTRIPYDDIYGRYKEHMPDFVQALDPPEFTEAIALACDVDVSDFQLGRSKLFCRPGKGAFLEDLKDRDLSEVIPILVAKIKEWEAKKKAKGRIGRSMAKWWHRRNFLRARKAANSIRHAHMSRKIKRQYAEARLERLRKKEEDAAKAAAEAAAAAKAKAEAEAKAAAEAIKASKDEAEKKKLEEAEKAAQKQREAEATAAKKAADAEAAKAKAETDKARKAAAAEKASEEKAKAAVRAQNKADAGKKGKNSAALLMGKDAEGGDKKAAVKKSGPPARVREDTTFTATINRKGGGGLGIEVDQVEGKPMIAAVKAGGAAARQTSMRPGDLVIKVFEYDTPTYDSALDAIRGATGNTVELTLLRRPVKTLVRSECEMHLGAGQKGMAWRGVTVEVLSNREVKYDTSKYAGTAISGFIPMRDAAELRLLDKHGGSCTMVIPTLKQTYEIRSKDGAVLHSLHRKLTRLFTSLGKSIRKEGWLSKKAEDHNRFTNRYCLLDSDAKLHYFKNEDAQKEQGVVDLQTCTGVSDYKSGMGFEMQTPGRTWIFTATDKDTQKEWMASITAMLNDLREAKKEQLAAEGSSTLKSSLASMCDDLIGEWRDRLWWELNSSGELRVFESEGGKEIRLVRLSQVSRVERAKGEDYYTFCLALEVEAMPGTDEEDYTLTLRPYGRQEMVSWLAILKKEVEKFEPEQATGGVGSLTLVQRGWFDCLRRADISGSSMTVVEDKGRCYGVLATEQKEVAQQMTVTSTFYWFNHEDDAKDLSNGSAVDLEEVESIVLGVAKAPGRRSITELLGLSEGKAPPEDDPSATALVLKLSDSPWQLELTPAPDSVPLAEWRMSLKANCMHAEGYDEMPPSMKSFAPGASARVPASTKGGGGNVLTATLKMIVPLGGTDVWRLFECELKPNGQLSYKQAASEIKSVPGGWASGTIDVTKSLGVWLLGAPSAPTLDIILTGKKYTFAATTDGEPGNPSKATLEKWRIGVTELMPFQPVKEVYSGWLEKKGEVGTAWKMRYFVLLSTRQLQYFEKEGTNKPRGTVELQFATAVRPLPDADQFYNYEQAIEIVTGKRRWILCPASAKEQKKWLDQLEPMIGGEAAVDEPDEPSAKPASRLSLVKSSPRARGVSMSVVSATEGKRGYLDLLAEDGEEMTRRFFVLEQRMRDGVREASLEYYLDDALTPDVDAETIELTQAECKLIKDAYSAGLHQMELTTSTGATYTLSSESQTEIASWHAVIEAAAAGRPASAPTGDASVPLSSIAASSKMPGAPSSKDRSVSGRSDMSISVALFGGPLKVPEFGLRVHAGFLTKKGEGLMAKSQQRWFVAFRNGELHYFDKEWNTEEELAATVAAKGHKGVISLAGVKASDVARTNPSKANDFSFTISTPKRKWALIATSQAQFDEWHKAITSLLEDVSIRASAAGAVSGKM